MKLHPALALPLIALAFISTAEAQGRHGRGVPTGVVPAGLCRVWYDNRPARSQPPPTSCRNAEASARRDRNARVIYGQAEPRYQNRGGYGNQDRYPDRSRQGAYQLRTPAFDNGYRDGYDKGRDDARDNDRFDPRRESRYRSADHGYDRRFGPKDAYKAVYRDGFVSGYEAGYRDSSRGRRW